jgi:hypothetical protein
MGTMMALPARSGSYPRPPGKTVLLVRLSRGWRP